MVNAHKGVPMHNRRILFRVIAAFLALAGVIVQWHDVQAQSGRQVMIVNDDGAGPMIRHFSMPDLMELREPDFTHRDVPIFQEKLVLSEAQVAAIERQITVYLDAFEQLKKSMLAFPGAEPMVFGPVKAMGGAAAPGEGEPATIVVAPGGGDLPMISMDELDEMEGEMGSFIDVRVTAEDGQSDQPEAGEPSVSVAIQSSADLPEDVRKKLEEQAQVVAEKIKAQIEEQRANGEAGDGAPPPPLPGLDDVSKFEERQAQIEEAAKNFRKAKTQLRHEFVIEAQSTLSEVQLERWPTLERALLREKSLPNGRLSGERTDLFKVIKPFHIDQTQLKAIAPHLDSYDVELDAALRQRNSVVEEAGPKIDKALSEQDFDRALAAIDRAIAARVLVRSINERYIEAIAGALPHEAADAFRAATLKVAYPQVYRSTFADKTFDAAYKLEGIDDSTSARLREIEQAYRSERIEHDARIRRAIDKHQPLEPRRPIEHMKQMQAAGGPEPGAMEMRMGEGDPIREALAKRRELDERYARMVADSLTPEQVARLPKPPALRKLGEPLIIRPIAGE
jgi:hypothetical protein